MRGLTFLAAAVLVAGCSDGLGGRVPVSGKVTVKGQPLKDGVIYFVPLDGQGSQANKPLTDGAFQFEGTEGLQPGKYLVRLSSAAKGTTVNEEEAGGPGGSANVTFAELVPPEWSDKSKQEVTVTAKGPNEFTFDIPALLEPKKKRK